MRSENFDKRVKEAADHHHPAYDEKAWQNMEKLLDLHLPQEKDDRRRFIFFLLFFLLLGGAGLWLFIGNKDKVKQELSVADMPVAVNKTEYENVSTNKLDKDNSENIGQTDLQTSPDPAAGLATTEKKEFLAGTDKKSLTPLGKKQPVLRNTADKNNNQNLSGNPVEVNESITPVIISGNEIKNNPVKMVVSPRPNDNATELNSQVIENKKPVENPDSKTDGISNTSVEEKSETKKVKQSAKKKKNSFFFVSLSAGPDLSFVSSDKAGTTKLLGGVGIGYRFNNGFSIRTGFYSGRKVYSASGENYNPPSEFFQYYPILEKVDANCKVFEIPVNVSYHFGNSTKQNWFAGAGLSTFLMNKEAYSYSYKYTSSGPSYQADWSINKENNHFFSVLTISGGYQRQLSKRVSLVAEPYFKVPLSGVGYGKVKLNSGGVLFTLSVKPFGENKN